MNPLVRLLPVLALAGSLRAAPLLPVEEEVTSAILSPQITVVHLWAPWCPNCKAELANDGWAHFLSRNPAVKFIFVTVWRGEQGDGRDLLEKYGVGSQPNFSLLVHPNASRKAEDKMSAFLGLPVTWIPSTWVFREGKLRYALNYGELRFPLLQQLIQDSSDRWEH